MFRLLGDFEMLDRAGVFAGAALRDVDITPFMGLISGFIGVSTVRGEAQPHQCLYVDPIGRIAFRAPHGKVVVEIIIRHFYSSFAVWFPSSRGVAQRCLSALRETCKRCCSVRSR